MVVPTGFEPVSYHDYDFAFIFCVVGKFSRVKNGGDLNTRHTKRQYVAHQGDPKRLPFIIISKSALLKKVESLNPSSTLNILNGSLHFDNEQFMLRPNVGEKTLMKSMNEIAPLFSSKTPKHSRFIRSDGRGL